MDTTRLKAGINALRSWIRARKVPVVLQTESSECALACLDMLANYHGHKINLLSLRDRFPSALTGVTLRQLMNMSGALGLDARALRVDLEYLRQAHMPCILHWDMNHFVVLCRVTQQMIQINDPAFGRRRLSMQEASKHFTGIVLEVAVSPTFKPIEANAVISIRRLTSQVAGLPSALLQLFGLALTIELLGLIVPYQIQVVIDRTLQSNQSEQLAILTAAFLLVIGIQTGFSIARSWLITWLSAALSAQWITNLFSHLLKLPLNYFEARNMGDIISRFSSVHAIQGTLTGSFVEAILDGLLGTLTLVILFLYSTQLTIWVLGALLIYCVLRIVAFRVAWFYNEEQLIYSARQQSLLMEAVRGIQAIKLANRLGVPTSRIENATVEAARRNMYSQRVTSLFAGLNRAIFGSLHVMLIGLGAILAMKGEFSLGMLVAYVAYASQFSRRIGGLVDKVNAFFMLRLQAERVSDIALAHEEPYTAGSYVGSTPVAPQIELVDLGFRYTDQTPWTFQRVNLSVEAGSSVAITGPVGCGKTTLAKVILGLLQPERGAVMLGGVDIRKFGLERYRDLIGAVMQDDSLFAGTIRENISFFEGNAPPGDVEAAAIVAHIHDDIMQMPMGYDSMIGDMGSALSGGQKQCVLLARALYRKPRILLLDEATSSLDVSREHDINEVVSGLQMTRIIIAHRASTVASADIVYEIRNGALRPVRGTRTFNGDSACKVEGL